ncbi:MAG: hypothetical protein ACXWXO_08710 [Nocardioides sp.]
MRTAGRSADERGREVVGLYGDPDTTWGIGAEVGLARNLAADEVERGLRALSEQHPHLGEVGPVAAVTANRWDEVRARTLAEPFRPGQPLVRAACTTDGEQGRSSLLVVAHHGVCDGLGLLSLLGAGAGTLLTPTAAGLGARPSRGSFLTTAPQRVIEALWRPPPRFPARGRSGPTTTNGNHLDEPADVVLVRSVERVGVGTAALCQALAQVFRERSGWDESGRGPFPLIFVGASRRAPGTTAPDRQTAYLRFRVDPRWTTAESTVAFASLRPEPDFPETSLHGLGPRLVRPLRSRLGATAVVSNLGVLEGEADWLAMYPALSGPAAVSVGLASTASRTTLSVRTRRREFGREDATDLLESLMGHLLMPPTAGQPRADG